LGQEPVTYAAKRGVASRTQVCRPATKEPAGRSLLRTARHNANEKMPLIAALCAFVVTGCKTRIAEFAATLGL